MKLTEDPRWRRFNDRSFRCLCCGTSFNGIFDIAFDHPDTWQHSSFRNNGGVEVRVGQDVLGSDFCVIEDDYFVRGLAEIPIIGCPERFAFGAWTSLRQDNYLAYWDAFGSADEASLGPFFGWLSNELPFYGTGAFLKTEVIFQGGSRRPLFRVWDESSLLADDQKSGISFDRLLDIYAASGNDIRSHLLDG